MTHIHTFAGALLALATAGSAVAGTLDSKASFQITSFSYVASGGTLSWVDASAYQTLYSESGEAGGLVSNDTDSSTLSALTTTTLATTRPHATSTVSANAAGTLQGLSTATPFVISAISQPHGAVSMAQQSREFTLSAPGSVTFTVGYSLSALGMMNNVNENYAVAMLDFSFGNYFNVSGGTQNVTLVSSDVASGSNAQTGTLTFTVDFGAPGEVGYYNLRGDALAYASASITAVPEPASYGLMLAGLAIVGAMVRRKSVARA